MPPGIPDDAQTKLSRSSGDPQTMGLYSSQTNEVLYRLRRTITANDHPNDVFSNDICLCLWVYNVKVQLKTNGQVHHYKSQTAASQNMIVWTYIMTRPHYVTILYVHIQCCSCRENILLRTGTARQQVSMYTGLTGVDMRNNINVCIFNTKEKSKRAPN